jgi:hypothetical protein
VSAGKPGMTGALPYDHLVVTFGDLCLALNGDETSFTGDLLRLVQKADRKNRELLRAGFPVHVAMWEIWIEIDGRAPVTAYALAGMTAQILILGLLAESSPSAREAAEVAVVILAAQAARRQATADATATTTRGGNDDASTEGQPK